MHVPPPEVIWLIFSNMGEYYSVMMVLNFFYIAISCDAEHYQLYCKWQRNSII